MPKELTPEEIKSTAITANELIPKEQLIDVSELEPPEPFEAVLKLIDKIGAGEYIRMIHRKQPLPLIELLESRGFECAIKQGTKSEWDIIIWHKSDKLVNDFCQKHFS